MCAFCTHMRVSQYGCFSLPSFVYYEMNTSILHYEYFCIQYLLGNVYLLYTQPSISKMFLLPSYVYHEYTAVFRGNPALCNQYRLDNVYLI